MQIRVIRGYSGEEGLGPDKDVREGAEHSVTRVRGNQLFANGLVEILSDEDVETDAPPIGGSETVEVPTAMTDPKPAAKNAAAVQNKAAPTPGNKVVATPGNKATPA